MSLIEPGCSVVFTKPDKLFHEYQNHHPLLDCDDCIGSDNDYNIKD